MRKGHKLQLAAYALLLESQPGPPIQRGVVCFLPMGTAESIAMTTALKNEARQVLNDIRAHLLNEALPPPADRWAKCRDCEYLRFCGDRYPGVEHGEA